MPNFCRASFLNIPNLGADLHKVFLFLHFVADGGNLFFEDELYTVACSYQCISASDNSLRFNHVFVLHGGEAFEHRIVFDTLPFRSVVRFLFAKRDHY